MTTYILWVVIAYAGGPELGGAAIAVSRDTFFEKKACEVARNQVLGAGAGAQFKKVIAICFENPGFPFGEQSQKN